MRTTVATLLLLVLAAVATGGEARSGDGVSARQLLTNPEPPSCKEPKCKEALKYGCKWLPKAYLKCDAGGKYKVPVKNCFKEKLNYISISVGDKCYKASSYGDVIAELELKCGEEIVIYGYDKHLKGDGSTACSEDNSRKAGDYCKTCKYTAKYDCGHPAHPGDKCRKAKGDCDKPAYLDDHCYCPKNEFKDEHTLCRKAYGKCDKPEYCPGDKAECPKDEFKHEGELCRGKYGDCDVADYCDGYSPKCDDKVEDKGKVCRKAAGPCDAAEKCDGYSKRCPKDFCVDYRKELKEPYCPVKIV